MATGASGGQGLAVKQGLVQGADGVVAAGLDRTLRDLHEPGGLPPGPVAVDEVEEHLALRGGQRGEGLGEDATGEDLLDVVVGTGKSGEDLIVDGLRPGHVPAPPVDDDVAGDGE